MEPPLSGAIKEVEDPFPNVFVEQVPFFGGAYRVFPGPIAGTSFQFRRLTESLFQDKSQWPRDFVDQVSQIVWGVLAISEVLAERFGLKRGTAGNSSEKGDVTIPSSRKLDSMNRAVSFSPDELQSVLKSVGVDVNALQGLIVRAGTFAPDDYSVDNGTLLHKPIVVCQEKMIVAAPQRLLSATNHLLLSLIVRAGLRDVFAGKYARSIELSADRSLEFLRHHPTNFLPTNPSGIDGSCERFYLFDSDKILYLLALCDTLQGFKQDTIEGTWASPQLAESVVNRARLVVQEIFSRVPLVNEILVLLVPSAVSRTPELAFNNWPETTLCVALTPDNLEVVSQAEPGNPLAIWRFAQKSNQAQEKRRIVYFDELDLFTAYRDRSYSYSVDDYDDLVPILIKPGYATKLKNKQANEQDWHPVRYLDPRFTVNVNSLYGNRATPLYAMPQSVLPCICVEGLPCILWVYPAQNIAEFERTTYFEFVTTVAYWIWQISPFLKEAVGNEMRSLQMIHVRVSLCASLVHFRPVLVESSPSVSCSAPSSGRVDISFEEGFAFLMHITDNSAERQMLRRLVPTLVQASGASLALTTEQIDSVVDKFAPQGLKRMLVHTDLSTVPQMDPRDLPPYRRIQSGEVEDLVDEVSRHVIEARGLRSGHLEPAICNAVLNDMVSYCFNELAGLVKTLKADRLVESLITFNDSLIRESAFTNLTIASRMKTFDESAHFGADLMREMADFHEAGMAGRFIIEFVAAQPPQGLRPIGLSVYDRLQALGREIIRLGSISDCCYFTLCDVELSVMPSSRIKLESSSYSAAQIMQLAGLASDQVAGSDDVFREHLGRHLKAVELPPEDAEINRATKAEFGHSISDLVRFLTAVGDISMDMKPITPSLMERSALISTLVAQLEWPNGKIEACLDLFSLHARSTYLPAPPHLKPAELYPWRFNRTISYLRRPLVARQRDGRTEILWGHRHLDSSRRYLVQLCSSTRLKADSGEMRSLLARFRHQAGKRFNDTVYKALQANPILLVRKQVSKFSNLRPDNLGDIDVLCAERDKRILWVMECKSLAMARTPYEMAMHLRDLTVGDGEHASIIARHQARSTWVEQHLGRVLESIGISSESGWRVQPLVVLDTTPLSPLFKQVSMPVISIDMLKTRWAT